MKFPTVRSVLNRLRWDGWTAERIDRVALLVVDRTSKNPKIVFGSDIQTIRRREFTTYDGTTIPLYKIIRVYSIDDDHDILWERPT